MPTYSIAGKKIQFFGKLSGANDSKFNRVCKLAAQYDELNEKFDRQILAGAATGSLNGRLALAAKLLLTTGVRIGNDESAAGYVTKVHPNNRTKVSSFVQTYGLTTLRAEHVKISAQRATLSFLGKAQVLNEYRITDPVAVAALKALKTAVPGGVNIIGVSDYEVTKYIKKAVGAQFSPKDFRTLRANIDAHEYALQVIKRPLPTTKKALNNEVRELLTHVSQVLSNTPAVCKSAYIDPCLIDWFVNKRWS